MNAQRQLAFLIFAILAAPSLSASILLSVDISDIESVFITATGAAPTVNESSVNNLNGISLLDFAGADSFANGVVPIATLLANGSAHSYNEWWFDDFGTGPRALNLYFGDAVNASLQLFDTGQPAFTGMIELNLLSVDLPAIGSFGDIVAGDSNGAGTIIGTFAIVPEPSAYAAILGCLGLSLALLRRPTTGD